MGKPASIGRIVWRAAASLLAATVLLAAGLLLWLYVDAHRERSDWFDARQGVVSDVERQRLTASAGLIDERVRITSDSGLAARARIIRPAHHVSSLPLVIVLGGHRTGSDAVALFRNPGDRAIVAFDYPYEGPLRTTGTWQTLAAIPAVRRASLDIAPAISLTLDWLLQEDWVDPARVTMVGVSLGVPFAATTAARDDRIDALLLVHGAADNRRWIHHNLALRFDAGPLLPVLSTVANWMIYGPLHDTGRTVADLSPRPVMVVGARFDERVPAGETEALYEAALEPKSLSWTEGLHVTPQRQDVLDELMEIADHLLPARD